MTDVALNFEYHPDPSQYLPATFSTSSAQPNSTSFGSYDLTGEQSIEVARPFPSASILDWSSLIAMTFQQFPSFTPQFYQLPDQDHITNSPQSHNNTSSSQQVQQHKNSNEMTAATFPDVDTSTQQNTMLQSSPPFVEPSVNYPCYPNSSTASNPVVLNNNLDHPPATNNYQSRNVYIGNYTQQQQYLDHNYPTCPTSHPSQLINYQQANNCLRQRFIYQNSPPVSTSSVGRQHHQKQISGSIGPNVSYSRPDNVNVTTSLPSSIASNLFPFNQSNHQSTMLVPSLFDHTSTIFTTKPAPQTTITIPNSTGSSASSSESTSPIKQSYSYSGPPKSYYSRLPLYDRPFKCDTCPQSFNRNHDLKRHKRIHLAVKPYPCPYCEKQFSRKDALKRHILVKGCNNNKRSTSPNNNNTAKSVDESSNSTGQKYNSPIESESPIKSEPTSDNLQYI